VVERVVAYVDGFNLYFGIRQAGWKKLYWLDVGALAEDLLRPGQRLVAVRYFTARISGPPDKQRRQNAFLEATRAVGKCSMHYGQYLDVPQTCYVCGAGYSVPKEKMTDVNIAVEMLSDAHQDLFDTALLISADSDLTPPVRKIKQLFPRKRIIIAFPPRRRSKRLTNAADGFIRVGRTNLTSSLLPERVRKGGGYVIRRPRNGDKGAGRSVLDPDP
jgi:uncharacterized LabA/DUF88 family protein